MTVNWKWSQPESAITGGVMTDTKRDIVERLRATAGETQRRQDLRDEAEEAAAEIERLRATLRFVLAGQAKSTPNFWSRF